MITFSCKYIASDGTKCTGHVAYKAAPVEILSVLADYKLVPELSLDDLPEIKMGDKFKTALNTNVESYRYDQINSGYNF